MALHSPPAAGTETITPQPFGENKAPAETFCADALKDTASSKVALTSSDTVRPLVHTPKDSNFSRKAIADFAFLG